MGRDREGSYRPWDALKSLLAAPEAVARQTRHPRRSVLRAYVAGSLPERPQEWSRARAEALGAARLTDWSRLEVAAHVSVCSRCRERLPRLRGTLTERPLSRIERCMIAMRRPRQAAVGWTLAGAQCVAIAGLLLWIVLVPADRGITKPDVLPALNQSSQMEFPQNESTYWVEFHPNASWQKVTEWLRSLTLEIEGPDENARYLLIGEGITADLLVTSGWIRRIHSEEGGSSE